MQVRRKLRTPRYYLATEKLPPNCVWTAAEAQVEFMADNIPEGAKVFVVSGASGGNGTRDAPPGSHGPKWLSLSLCPLRFALSSEGR